MLEFAFFTEALWLIDDSLEASDNLPYMLTVRHGG
jgi:hypothetical protein